MELLQEILGQLAALFRSYFEWWGRAVMALNREFEFNLSPPVTDVLGVLAGALVLYAFVNRVGKWERKGNKPQEFPLKTAQTPDQVVAQDRDKRLMALLKLSLFVLFLVVVASWR